MQKPVRATSASPRPSSTTNSVRLGTRLAIRKLMEPPRPRSQVPGSPENNI